MQNNNIHFFLKEQAFEDALVALLPEHGWESEVIVQPDEDDLVRNWANIIYTNNRALHQLGNYPLTDTEMQQIINKVNDQNSPYEMSRFINGGQVCIKRDNSADTHNCGKEVYLKIFDAVEIAAGQSRYQIVRQPRFRTADAMRGDRRGDVMLLINGMPVIHIELKRSRVDVSQAVYQIKRYMHEGVFAHGIFSMVQIFVAMTPEETLYFANPGREEGFKPEFQFHWEDFNNEVVSDWRRVVSDLLSIPMAHQMIGYYTVADEKDTTLKVMRSYQYYAASKISDVVHQTNQNGWDNHHHRGGYVWHTTGSGKTLTSFKSAQLIANSGDADKVVFLMDRIELATQSLNEYRGFASDDDAVQGTEDTTMLLSKLKSTDNDDRLIVTSLQKMSNIKAGTRAQIPQQVIDSIGQKRLVLIIDECHRSVFGQMLLDIKNTFPRALLFGFTGTPVFEENARDEIMTETIFGDMLHKYTISSGIADGNVLGFDPYMVNTYDENELREIAALNYLNVQTLQEIEGDEEKMKKYNHIVKDLKMPDTYTEGAREVHGVEHYLPKKIYQSTEHHQAVAADIIENWERFSHDGMFHAMLATKNIPEAIAYYKLFREQYPSMNVVAVFDNNIDNSDEGIAREDTLVEMLNDYNEKYQTTFQLANYLKYKKDVAKRLAHKKPYIGIEGDHAQQIDILIVVTQMLTGYDSKWVNTLYVDKVMEYVNVIQAFSRANRLFGPEKPFGIIRYYAFPYTMEQNIQDALEVYVDRPLGVFVDKLENNLMAINQKFLHIRDIFQSHGIMNFKCLPDTREDRMMFAKDFRDMTRHIEAARMQGFRWDKPEYEFQHGDTYTHVRMELTEETYRILLQRYKELFTGGDGGGGDDDLEYPIDTHITETGTGTIDAEYLNSKFRKFIKNLYMHGPGSELTKAALSELHKTFATLSQEDQRTAMVILHDIQRGDLHLENGKTIYDYITQYQLDELHKQINTLAEATGLNASQLENIMRSDINEHSLNDFNRFENLKSTLDRGKTREFLSKVTGKVVPLRMVLPKADTLLRSFILDAEQRKLILRAYLNDDITLETAAQMPEEDVPVVLPEKTEEVVPDIDKITTAVRAILSDTLSGVIGQMRSLDEVLGSVFFVIDTPSIDSLDSVGIFIKRALTNLYVKQRVTIVDKFVASNLLVTKFEAYLKKLYYLIHAEEVKPQYEGQDVTLKNVIHSIPCLWNLKYSQDASRQKLYQYLEKMKNWRNSESHISPTASEQEVDRAIRIALTLYFYATGSNITELEMAGHDPEAGQTMGKSYMIGTQALSPVSYEEEEAHSLGMAAESHDVSNLLETDRTELLKRSINKLLGYTPSKSVFSKQRHWEAIYRIAADYGFIIDGDYNQFKRFIEAMQLSYVPATINEDVLERLNKGVYAGHIDDWSANGLTGRELSAYNDIKTVADKFREIVNSVIEQESHIKKGL